MAVTSRRFPQPQPVQLDDAATVDDIRARLSEEAQYVMDNSLPYPTPKDLVAITRGEMDLLDKSEPENPEMPPLHFQWAMLDRAYANDAQREVSQRVPVARPAGAAQAARTER